MKYRTLIARCWMLAAGCSLLSAFQDAPSPTPQDPQAELTAQQIFGRMVEKITESTTVQCTFKATRTEAEGPMSAEGKILFKGDKKLRYKARLQQGDEGGTLTYLLNHGEERVIIQDDGQPQTEQSSDASEGAASQARAVVAKIGAFTAVMRAAAGITGDTTIAVSDLILEGRERVHERDTLKVSYAIEISWNDHKDKIAAEIWIDSESFLPLQRVLKSEDGQIEDTYSNWKLDEEIDDGEFEIE